MTRRPAVPGRRAVLLAAVSAVATACGVPRGGVTRDVPADEVPYGLLSPAPSASATGSRPVEADAGPRVYFLDTDRVLVPVPLSSADAGNTSPLQALLARLAAGPNPRQRAQGLTSALGPGAALELLDLRDGTARIDVSQLVQDPAADRLPFAVGQIVLTATSVPGVDTVRLLRDGEPLEVPLPGGARTSALLSERDYAALTQPGTATPGP